MGIVVSLAMLLGIVFLLFERFYKAPNASRFTQISLGFLVLSGLWNSVWYGLSNINTFWGLAGFVSGVFILMASLLVYKKGLGESSMAPFAQTLIRILVVMGLILCFALYVITIVRINLSLPIIA